MKLINILIFFLWPVCLLSAAEYPEAQSGYVSDHADLLSLEEEEEIERWLWQTESRTNVEIAVVTIRSIKDFSAAKNKNIEQFSKALFNHYAIGNLPENNGVLLLVAKDDRRVRIQLGKAYGDGFSEAANGIIQKSILPYFKEENYAKGVREGVLGIILEYAGLRIGLNWPLILSCLGIIILIPVTISLFKSGKRGWGWICVGFIFVLLLAVIYTLVKILKHMPNSRSSSWSSGGFGGGFGGGSSGGGGATGSW